MYQFTCCSWHFFTLYIWKDKCESLRGQLFKNYYLAFTFRVNQYIIELMVLPLLHSNINDFICYRLYSYKNMYGPMLGMWLEKDNGKIRNHMVHKNLYFSLNKIGMLCLILKKKSFVDCRIFPFIMVYPRVV